MCYIKMCYESTSCRRTGAGALALRAKPTAFHHSEFILSISIHWNSSQSQNSLMMFPTVSNSHRQMPKHWNFKSMTAPQRKGFPLQRRQKPKEVKTSQAGDALGEQTWHWMALVTSGHFELRKLDGRLTALRSGSFDCEGGGGGSGSRFRGGRIGCTPYLAQPLRTDRKAQVTQLKKCQFRCPRLRVPVFSPSFNLPRVQAADGALWGYRFSQMRSYISSSQPAYFCIRCGT